MLLFIVPAILLIGFGSAQTINDCPVGVPRDTYLKVHGGFCFDFFVPSPVDYNTANAECNKHGGTLPIVTSKDISDFLIDQLVYEYGAGSRIWIGLNDKATEGTYVWEDGTPLSSSYSNWDPSRNSTSANHDCVNFDPTKNGVWNEDYCEDTFFGLFEHERPYVCQYKARAGSVTTTHSA
ncbi:hypothetical protein BsWGS_15386 [Bradybaena similaris]